jgi:hypothetical protein
MAVAAGKLPGCELGNVERDRLIAREIAEFVLGDELTVCRRKPAPSPADASARWTSAWAALSS